MLGYVRSRRVHHEHEAAPAHDGDLARGHNCAQTRQKHATDTAHTGRERGYRGGLCVKHLDIAILTAAGSVASSRSRRAAREGARARAWADGDDPGLIRHVRAMEKTMPSQTWRVRVVDELLLHLPGGAPTKSTHQLVRLRSRQRLGGWRRARAHRGRGGHQRDGAIVDKVSHACHRGRVGSASPWHLDQFVKQADGSAARRGRSRLGLQGEVWVLDGHATSQDPAVAVAPSGARRRR